MLQTLLKERFNTAAEQFASGSIEAALETYRSVFTPSSEGEIDPPSESFCFEVRLRIAFCLIELQDYVEAKGEFESEGFQRLLPWAGPAQREAYYFSYANLVAKAGEYDLADQLLKQAQEIAINYLRSIDAFDKICRFRLHWAHHFGQWTALLNLAKEIKQQAEQLKLTALMHWATEAACFALRGLHQYQEAKQGAEQIRARLSKAGASDAHLQRWNTFISDLSA